MVSSQTPTNKEEINSKQQTMIAANELRIGNWVNAPKMVVLSECKTSEANDLLPYQIRFVEGHDYKLYEPIPLTPEILEKCGFSYLKIKGVASLDEYNPAKEENTHNWTLNIKREGIYDGEGRFELVKWGDSPKEKIWFSNQWLRVEIKNLHQLQNIFFALTGQELEIKL